MREIAKCYNHGRLNSNIWGSVLGGCICLHVVRQKSEMTINIPVPCILTLYNPFLLSVGGAAYDEFHFLDYVTSES